MKLDSCERKPSREKLRWYARLLPGSNKKNTKNLTTAAVRGIFATGTSYDKL
jgi:hypothetical protein